jgi:hypothetical protein
MMLTQERLRHLVLYEPETGLFFYKNRFHSHLNGQRIARAPDGSGYLLINIDGRCYGAHRLAWLYMTGDLPKDTIDHRDLNKLNNRWHNLREATRSQQKANSRKRSDSSSPFKGVSWRPRQRKWQANVTRDGTRHHLGYFRTAEEASAAYEAAATRLFGQFARAA